LLPVFPNCPGLYVLVGDIEQLCRIWNAEPLMNAPVVYLAYQVGAHGLTTEGGGFLCFPGYTAFVCLPAAESGGRCCWRFESWGDADQDDAGLRVYVFERGVVDGSVSVLVHKDLGVLGYGWGGRPEGLAEVIDVGGGHEALVISRR